MSDLISRQNAITIPVMPKEDRQYQTMNIDDAYERGWYDLQDCIESLPSAEPKTGEWIEEHEHVYIGDGVKEWTNWYCSECDAPNDKPTDFCPHCGCDMRDEEE